MRSIVPHAKNEAGDVIEERLDFVVWIGVFEETCAKATGQETLLEEIDDEIDGDVDE